jgi:TrmH family RNA methyltransferase
MIAQFHEGQFKGISKSQVKYIKSLRFKKYRIVENSFLLEGEKNVSLLLSSHYQVTMLIATSVFLTKYTHLLQNSSIPIYPMERQALNELSALEENYTALAVATIPTPTAFQLLPQRYSLVLDNITNPGNLGTIIRIADWYSLGGIVCSPNTVELYNPKVLQASMGSFINVPVHYTDLPSYLANVTMPIIGTFTRGESIHSPDTVYPTEGLVVVGNEVNGINTALLPYIQQKLCIPRYGGAESLNAAVATAIVCDNLMRVAHPQ